MTEILLLLAVLYFLPWIIAALRRHHNSGAIFVLNLFLGWTFLGWVGALVWSATSIRRAPAPDEMDTADMRSPRARRTERVAGLIVVVVAIVVVALTGSLFIAAMSL